MEQLLRLILKNTTVQLLTKEIYNDYRSFTKIGFGENSLVRDISSTINGWGLFSKEYNSNLNNLSNWLTEHNGLHDYGALKIFMDIFILTHKLPKTVQSDINETDIFIFSNFTFPISDFYFFPSALRRCMGKYISLPFLSKDALIYRDFGVNRRLLFMAKEMEVFSSIYTLDRLEQLSPDEDFQLGTQINFLYFNMLAVFDCLAFILQYELGVINPFNYKRDKSNIGLFKENFLNGPLVDTNISAFAPWEKEIKDMRHSIAHRLLYSITPVLTSDEQAQQQNLLAEMAQMVLNFEPKQIRYSNELKNIVKNGTMDQFTQKQDEFDKDYAELETIHDKKYHEYVNIGIFTGTFCNDIYKRKLYHMSRFLLDINKFIWVIEEVYKVLETNVINTPKST